MERPPKALAFAFWRLRAYFRLTAPDAYAEYVAGMVIVCTEGVGVLAVLFGAFDLLKRRVVYFVSPVLTLVLIGAVLIALNLKVLNIDGWKRYEREFEEYPRRKKVLGSICVIAVIALIWAAVILAVKVQRRFTMP